MFHILWTWWNIFSLCMHGRRVFRWNALEIIVYSEKNIRLPKKHFAENMTVNDFITLLFRSSIGITDNFLN